MKTFKIKYVLMVCITMLFFSACTDEIVRDPSPIQEGGIQAFIYGNTPSKIAFLPPDNQEFNVIIGRKTTAAETLNLIVSDASNVFTVPSSIAFQAGQMTDTVKVKFNLTVGTIAKLSISLAKTDAYIYANDSVSITVSRDYTWISAGKVTMYSGWAGGSAEIALEKAKESVGIYRILSPYYVLEPAYCPNPGYHLQFELDANYNAVSLPMYQNIGEPASSGGFWWLYWNSAKSYCSFTNVGNAYTIKGAWSKEVDGVLTPTYNATESFDWTTGYPGTN